MARNFSSIWVFDYYLIWLLSIKTTLQDSLNILRSPLGTREATCLRWWWCSWRTPLPPSSWTWSAQPGPATSTTTGKWSSHLFTKQRRCEYCTVWSIDSASVFKLTSAAVLLNEERHLRIFLKCTFLFWAVFWIIVFCQKMFLNTGSDRRWNLFSWNRSFWIYKKNREMYA